MKIGKDVTLGIVLIFLLAVPTLADNEASADALAVAEGTSSASAGVLVGVDGGTAYAGSMAASGGSTDSSETIASAIGQNVAAVSVSLSDNHGTIAGSIAAAVGQIISLFSQATAIGSVVYGEAGAEVTAAQMASAGVITQTTPLDNGLYQVTVQASADGQGDASGSVYALAWADDASNYLSNLLQPQPQPVVQPVQERNFYGFTFGKCDVQRYKHFWLQLRDNSTENDVRARYWMEVIAWDSGERSPGDFEEKWDISNKIPPNGLDGNGDKNGKWCKLP